MSLKKKIRELYVRYWYWKPTGGRSLLELRRLDATIAGFVGVFGGIFFILLSLVVKSVFNFPFLELGILFLIFGITFLIIRKRINVKK